MSRLLRLVRAAGLLDRAAAEQVAVANGVCVHPLVMRRMDVQTGRSDLVHLPCGSSRESWCRPCAKRYRQVRMAQCREGWHLEAEPVSPAGGAGGGAAAGSADELGSAAGVGADGTDGTDGTDGAGVGAGGESCDPDAMSDEQYGAYLRDLRVQALGWRADAVAAGAPTDDLDAAIADLDEEIRAAGLPEEGDGDGDGDGGESGGDGESGGGGQGGSRRARSTRRRQDAPDLPKRRMSAETLGRVFRSPDGKAFRPSMFLTLTLPSYGRVKDGAPVDPGRYDYISAARDALHFGKLVDRFVQNLRRVAGFSVQYFAVVEYQHRKAPHLHMAIRGTLPRADLRRVVAATYHQVWWPLVAEVRYDGDELLVWQDGAGYVDAVTGEVLPTWDEALDALGADPDAVPLHVVRFGKQLDMQGVLAGTRDADQCIRYLAKYLGKSLGEGAGAEIPAAGPDDSATEAAGPVDGSGADDPGVAARRAHARALLAALRFEPCTPECANWLRYGVQPRHARAGLVAGWCRGKAHRPDCLGYGGRRVLVSRRWSGKTMGQHKADRRVWVMTALGIEEKDDGGGGRCLWRPVRADDPGLDPIGVRLLREVARRQRWRAELAAAGLGAGLAPPGDSAIGAGGAAGGSGR
ncbi:replication initiator [Acrocarpospora sp. B8E8]|uniref:replication initiator n=1 Tax=Acrocarpospora sp. B8E8 TaxID=3153572 RepID=UPI00325F5DB8